MSGLESCRSNTASISCRTLRFKQIRGRKAHAASTTLADYGFVRGQLPGCAKKEHEKQGMPAEGRPITSALATTPPRRHGDTEERLREDASAFGVSGTDPAHGMQQMRLHATPFETAGMVGACAGWIVLPARCSRKFRIGCKSACFNGNRRSAKPEVA